MTTCSLQNGYSTPEKGEGGKRVTVRGWLEGREEEEDEEEEDEEEEETHDHSQCSSLHCIRSYFTKK